MTAKGKILVTISSAPDAVSAACIEDDGEPLHFLIADAIVETIDRSELSVLELRMVLPVHKAQAMLLGMVEGEIEIAISRMSPVMGLPLSD